MEQRIASLLLLFASLLILTDAQCPQPTLLRSALQNGVYVLKRAPTVGGNSLNCPEGEVLFAENADSEQNGPVTCDAAQKTWKASDGTLVGNAQTINAACGKLKCQHMRYPCNSCVMDFEIKNGVIRCLRGSTLQHPHFQATVYSDGSNELTCGADGLWKETSSPFAHWQCNLNVAVEGTNACQCGKKPILTFFNRHVITCPPGYHCGAGTPSFRITDDRGCPHLRCDGQYALVDKDGSYDSIQCMKNGQYAFIRQDRVIKFVTNEVDVQCARKACQNCWTPLVERYFYSPQWKYAVDVALLETTNGRDCTKFECRYGSPNVKLILTDGNIFFVTENIQCDGNVYKTSTGETVSLPYMFCGEPQTESLPAFSAAGALNCPTPSNFLKSVLVNDIYFQTGPALVQTEGGVQVLKCPAGSSLIAGSAQSTEREQIYCDKTRGLWRKRNSFTHIGTTTSVEAVCAKPKCIYTHDPCSWCPANVERMENGRLTCIRDNFLALKQHHAYQHREAVQCLPSGKWRETNTHEILWQCTWGYQGHSRCDCWNAQPPATFLGLSGNSAICPTDKVCRPQDRVIKRVDRFGCPYYACPDGSTLVETTQRKEASSLQCSTISKKYVYEGAMDFVASSRAQCATKKCRLCTPPKHGFVDNDLYDVDGYKQLLAERNSDCENYSCSDGGKLVLATVGSRNVRVVKRITCDYAKGGMVDDSGNLVRENRMFCGQDNIEAKGVIFDMTKYPKCNSIVWRHNPNDPFQPRIADCFTHPTQKRIQVNIDCNHTPGLMITHDQAVEGNVTQFIGWIFIDQNNKLQWVEKYPNRASVSPFDWAGKEPPYLRCTKSNQKGVIVK